MNEPNLTAGNRVSRGAPVDSSNWFSVGRRSDGVIIVKQPPRWVMSRNDALNLAAWLRAMADPDGQEFERLVEEIEGRAKIGT